MEVKKIVEGMTAPQVAQVIDDNFKNQNKILEEDIAKQNNVIGVSEYKDFSEAEAVNVGDVRKYNGLLYECVEATTGAFDASKWKKSSFKAETEKKLSELGSYVENPEYARAYTDAEGRFLWGIRHDGSIEWAKGVPKPIKDFIALVDLENDEEVERINQLVIGLLADIKPLKETYQYISNPEWACAVVDENGRLLMGLRNDGTPYFPTKEVLGVLNTRENFAWMLVDKNNKIIECVDNKGKRYLNQPTNEDDKLSKRIDELQKSINISHSGNVVHFELNRLKCGWDRYNNIYHRETIIQRYKGADGDIKNYWDDNQSIAISNGLLFEFKDVVSISNGSSVAVFDLATNEIVGYGVIDFGVANHNNSAQFTDIYYTESDEFPLLLLSQCTRTEGDNCFVVRVQRNGSDFSFTKVKEISQNIANTNLLNFASWGYDSMKNELFATFDDKYNYDTYKGEKDAFLNLLVFDCPSFTDSDTIIIEEKDIKKRIRLPWCVAQACTGFNGKYFLNIQIALNPWWKNTIGATANSELCIIDSQSGMIEQLIATGDGECEGVAIWNNNIYISSRHGSAKENELAMEIRKINV